MNSFNFPENFSKGIAALSLTAVSAYFDELLLPVVILVFTMALDYASGMVKAAMTGTLSSRVGIVGILKKICYLLAVGVGVGADCVIANASGAQRFESPVACLVAVWLIINELISVLENIRDIGVPLPPFLCRLIKRLLKDADGSENEDGSV